MPRSLPIFVRSPHRPTRRRRLVRGVTLVEYLVLVGMVAVVAFVGFRRFGSTLTRKVDGQADRVQSLEGAAGAVAAAEGGAGKAALCDGVDCACFVAGTPVATPEGLRPIESLRPGDRVLARDGATGAVDFKPVVRTYVTPSKPVLDVEITAPDGAVEILGVTAEHPFYVEGRGWVRAGLLAFGERGVSSIGASVALGATMERDELVTVYNLEVEGFHTYFVGRTGVWVHNQYRPRNGADPSHAGWGGSYRPSSHFAPPAPPPPLPDLSLGGPDGVGGSSTRPRLGDRRPAANGGEFVLVAMSRPSYMPTNLVAPFPGSTFAASGTPLAPAVWAGQVAGVGLWGAEWYAYLTDGTVWRYVPPPRPHPVIRAR